MNYRHIYHAGNLCDVFKHIVYVELLLKLREKEKPFCIIETHAGLGLYPLISEEAQKTKEYQQGISRFIKNADHDLDFSAYIKVIKSVNGKEIALKNYPGSPLFGKYFLRKQDKIKLFEPHPADFTLLKSLFEKETRAKIYQENGYQSLKSCLPLLEKRGLVFIDPPFEEKDEFIKILSALQEGQKRFAYGMYAVWYPLKKKKEEKDFYQKICHFTSGNLPLKTLGIELYFDQNPQIGQLNGCGMVIINPPWLLEERLKHILPKLIKYLELSGSFHLQKTE